MKIINHLKKDVVLCVAILLAVISMFFVMPDKEYAGYVDFNTLMLLFALMSVMAGLRSQHFFRYIGKSIIKRVNNERQLVLVLVLLPFIFSMFMTNDVALIIFVPLALIILKMSGTEQYVIFVVVAQTIAANLGSMLMPTGNPQNLYLYSLMDIKLSGFVKIMLPYTICSLVLLAAWCVVKGKSSKIDVELEDEKIGNKKLVAVYLVLFVICLLSVAKFYKAIVPAAICLLVFLLVDRSVLLMVDYNLLMTFVGFFIFIGNMSRIEAFKNLVEGLVSGHEAIMSVAFSQIISNVPCALLMSGFTNKYDQLIIGTNLGGLGTLIASMASLISYKMIAAEKPELKGKYFMSFTLANVGFLAILLALFFVLN